MDAELAEIQRPAKAPKIAPVAKKPSVEGKVDVIQVGGSLVPSYTDAEGVGYRTSQLYYTKINKADMVQTIEKAKEKAERFAKKHGLSEYTMQMPDGSKQTFQVDPTPVAKEAIAEKPIPSPAEEVEKPILPIGKKPSVEGKEKIQRLKSQLDETKRRLKVVKEGGAPQSQINLAAQRLNEAEARYQQALFDAKIAKPTPEAPKVAPVAKKPVAEDWVDTKAAEVARQKATKLADKTGGPHFIYPDKSGKIHISRKIPSAKTHPLFAGQYSTVGTTEAEKVFGKAVAAAERDADTKANFKRRVRRRIR
jgi:hypothetical protein